MPQSHAYRTKLVISSIQTNIFWCLIIASTIGHVRYINILTWLRGFQVKPLYLVLFSLSLSLFWELRDKGNLKICNFDPKASESCSNIDISNVAYCLKTDQIRIQFFSGKKWSMSPAKKRLQSFDYLPKSSGNIQQFSEVVGNLLRSSEDFRNLWKLSVNLRK